MSPPHENVLFVPNRNVRLTGVRLGVGRTRSSDHDPAGSRPAGGAEESTKEADHTEAGGERITAHRTSGTPAAEGVERRGRQSRSAPTAGTTIQPGAERRG